MEIESGLVLLEQGRTVFMNIVAEDPQPPGHPPILHTVRPDVRIVAVAAEHAAFFVDTLRNPHRFEHQDADTDDLVAADQLGGPQSLQLGANGHVSMSLLVAGG